MSGYCQTIKLLGIYALIAVTFCGSIGLSSGGCPSLFSEEQIFRKLEAVGFDSFIIERLRNEKAEVLKRFVLSSEEITPVIFYRGLRTAPKKYDPKRYSVRYGNDTWMSQLFAEAYFWGAQSGDESWPGGIILKYQIPKFLIEKEFQIGPNGKIADNVAIGVYDNPELFITHLGLINYSAIQRQYEEYKKRNGNDLGWNWLVVGLQNIEWLPYERVIRDLEKFRAQFP